MEQFHGTTILSIRRNGRVVIGGDGPRAEFTDQAMERLEKAGVWSPQNA